MYHTKGRERRVLGINAFSEGRQGLWRCFDRFLVFRLNHAVVRLVTTDGFRGARAWLLPSIRRDRWCQLLASGELLFDLFPLRQDLIGLALSGHLLTVGMALWFLSSGRCELRVLGCCTVFPFGPLLAIRG